MIFVFYRQNDPLRAAKYVVESFLERCFCMANIKILVGSVYGNALDVAESCGEKLVGLSHSVTLLRAPQIENFVADDSDVFLICTSTTGQGEIPDSLMQLYCQLKDRCPPMPTKRYGLIALGDSGYETFAEAGHLMDELMQELQLMRVGEPLLIDACETRTPSEDATVWLESWVELL